MGKITLRPLLISLGNWPFIPKDISFNSHCLVLTSSLNWKCSNLAMIRSGSETRLHEVSNPRFGVIWPGSQRKSMSRIRLVYMSWMCFRDFLSAFRVNSFCLWTRVSECRLWVGPQYLLYLCWSGGFLRDVLLKISVEESSSSSILRGDIISGCMFDLSLLTDVCLN